MLRGCSLWSSYFFKSCKVRQGFFPIGAAHGWFRLEGTADLGALGLSKQAAPVVRIQVGAGDSRRFPCGEAWQGARD